MTHRHDRHVQQAQCAQGDDDRADDHDYQAQRLSLVLHTFELLAATHIHAPALTQNRTQSRGQLGARLVDLVFTAPHQHRRKTSDASCHCRVGRVLWFGQLPGVVVHVDDGLIPGGFRPDHSDYTQLLCLLAGHVQHNRVSNVGLAQVFPQNTVDNNRADPLVDVTVLQPASLHRLQAEQHLIIRIHRLQCQSSKSVFRLHNRNPAERPGLLGSIDFFDLNGGIFQS